MASDISFLINIMYKWKTFSPHGFISYSQHLSRSTASTKLKTFSFFPSGGETSGANPQLHLNSKRSPPQQNFTLITRSDRFDRAGLCIFQGQNGPENHKLARLRRAGTGGAYMLSSYRCVGYQISTTSAQQYFHHSSTVKQKLISNSVAYTFLFFITHCVFWLISVLLWWITRLNVTRGSENEVNALLLGAEDASFSRGFSNIHLLWHNRGQNFLVWSKSPDSRQEQKLQPSF